MKGDGQIKSRRIDYKLEEDYFYGARFIFECGYKLKGHPLTLATAATIYHKFFRYVIPFFRDDIYLITICLSFYCFRTKVMYYEE